jgi:predicted glutamine amidotransferase
MIAWRPAGKGKAGSNIPNRVIDTALTRHPDGYGLGWRDHTGALKWEKFGPSERQAFRKLLKRVDADGCEYVAHFRWATHGPKCAELAHPYVYDDPEAGTVLVFHNGVINIATAAGESDTQTFVRDVLAHLPTRWWQTPALRYLVRVALDGDRMVVMTADETYCLTEKDGHWTGGIWYSSDEKPYSWQSDDDDLYGRYANWGVSAQNTATWKYDPETKCWVNQQTGETLASPGTPAVTPTDDKAACKVVIPRNRRERRKARRQAVREDDSTLATDDDWDLTLRHAGHAVRAKRLFSRTQDGEYADAVECVECGTSGTVYVIDGEVYFDLDHMSGPMYSDDEEQDANAYLAREAAADIASALLPA